VCRDAYYYTRDTEKQRILKVTTHIKGDSATSAVRKIIQKGGERAAETTELGQQRNMSCLSEDEQRAVDDKKMATM
jgi:hypothetical protein